MFSRSKYPFLEVTRGPVSKDGDAPSEDTSVLRGVDSVPAGELPDSASASESAATPEGLSEEDLEEKRLWWAEGNRAALVVRLLPVGQPDTLGNIAEQLACCVPLRESVAVEPALGPPVDTARRHFAMPFVARRIAKTTTFSLCSGARMSGARFRNGQKWVGAGHRVQDGSFFARGVRCECCQQYTTCHHTASERPAHKILVTVLRKSASEFSHF